MEKWFLHIHLFCLEIHFLIFCYSEKWIQKLWKNFVKLRKLTPLINTSCFVFTNSWFSSAKIFRLNSDILAFTSWNCQKMKFIEKCLKTSRIFTLCFKSNRFQCFRTFEMNKSWIQQFWLFVELLEQFREEQISTQVAMQNVNIT